MVRPQEALGQAPMKPALASQRLFFVGLRNARALGGVAFPLLCVLVSQRVQSV